MLPSAAERAARRPGQTGGRPPVPGLREPRQGLDRRGPGLRGSVTEYADLLAWASNAELLDDAATARLWRESRSALARPRRSWRAHAACATRSTRSRGRSRGAGPSAGPTWTLSPTRLASRGAASPSSHRRTGSSGVFRTAAGPRLAALARRAVRRELLHQRGPDPAPFLPGSAAGISRTARATGAASGATWATAATSPRCAASVPGSARAGHGRARGSGGGFWTSPPRPAGAAAHRTRRRTGS